MGPRHDIRQVATGTTPGCHAKSAKPRQRTQGPERQVTWYQSKAEVGGAGRLGPTREQAGGPRAGPPAGPPECTQAGPTPIGLGPRVWSGQDSRVGAVACGMRQPGHVLSMHRVAQGPWPARPPSGQQPASLGHASGTMAEPQPGQGAGVCSSEGLGRASVPNGSSEAFPMEAGGGSVGGVGVHNSASQGWEGWGPWLRTPSHHCVTDEQ